MTPSTRRGLHAAWDAVGLLTSSWFGRRAKRGAQGFALLRLSSARQTFRGKAQSQIDGVGQRERGSPAEVDGLGRDGDPARPGSGGSAIEKLASGPGSGGAISTTGRSMRSTGPSGRVSCVDANEMNGWANPWPVRARLMLPLQVWPRIGESAGEGQRIRRRVARRGNGERLKAERRRVLEAAGERPGVRDALRPSHHAEDVLARSSVPLRVRVIVPGAERAAV